MLLSGILPAIVTPFDDSDRFHSTSFENLSARLYESGVDGLYVCGNTGEGMQQPSWQRKLVAEAAVRCSPKGKLVIVHVGAATLEETIDLASHATRAGAQAVSSLPPPGALTSAEVLGFYRRLAQASPAPLIVYHFPAASPVSLSSEEVHELCALENVAGIKFTDKDLFLLWQLAQAGVPVFNGFDEVLAAGLLMGASGGIGSIYNLAPKSFVSLYAASRAGRWDEARRLQTGINELISAILRYPVRPAVKALLGLTGIACGPCLPPGRTLAAAERDDLAARVRATALGAAILGEPVEKT
jgi:N-acetylneuraminate lyase